MRHRLALTALVAILAIAGCGGSEPALERSDLPPSLAEALLRLEQAGFDARAQAVGPDKIPGVVVNAEEPVVLAVAPPGGNVLDLDLPLIVHDPPIEDPSLTKVSCGGSIAAGQNGQTNQRVLRASGLCEDRGKDGL